MRAGERSSRPGSRRPSSVRDPGRSRPASTDVVYRDARGVEYVSVPLPTHEVTEAVSLDARQVGRRSAPAERPFYEGTDGEELAAQPSHHRKRWSDAQWGAFEEYRRTAEDVSRTDPPTAGVVIVTSRRPSPSGPHRD